MKTLEESPVSPEPKPPATVGAHANAAPALNGALSVVLGDTSLRIEKCARVEISPTVSRCDGDTYVDLNHEGKAHSLLLTSLYLDSEATIYRGPLDQSYKQNGHSFVLTDVDGDGREDLVVWTGKEGAYGGPSYEVLLFDAQNGQFNVAPMLSELTVGANGLFSIENGRLTSSSSNGCCMWVIETFTIEKSEPHLVERVTEERDESTGKLSRKTERPVDGTLKPVK